MLAESLTFSLDHNVLSRAIQPPTRLDCSALNCSILSCTALHSAPGWSQLLHLTALHWDGSVDYSRLQALTDHITVGPTLITSRDRKICRESSWRPLGTPWKKHMRVFHLLPSYAQPLEVNEFNHYPLPYLLFYSIDDNAVSTEDLWVFWIYD